ncbi:MAG TPA: hypothetical protein VMW91_04560 [Desulfosporosinus sp.]|nr:hypothetical protein [Desulfosporosinus sp.]
MKPYIVVEEKEALNEDGTVKEGYEKRAYCYVKLIPLTTAQEQAEKDIINKEALIQAKIREQAISALVVEGKLTLDGEIANTK